MHSLVVYQRGVIPTAMQFQESALVDSIMTSLQSSRVVIYLLLLSHYVGCVWFVVIASETGSEVDDDGAPATHYFSLSFSSCIFLHCSTCGGCLYCCYSWLTIAPPP